MLNKKICIVADVPNWAFDRIATQIKNELGYKYDIRVAYFNRRTESDYLYEFIEENDDCDLLHFLNRRILLLMNTDVFKNKVEKSGRSLQNYIAEKREKFTTAVYDYMDYDANTMLEYGSIYNEFTKCYYTATKKLFDIYSSIKEIKKPAVMIHDICDGKIFIPMNLERFDYKQIKDRDIVVGWVGNSKHADEDNVDLKGFYSILVPVVEELKNEGYLINFLYADRNVQWLTTEEMPIYYSKIDICICVSIHEGTPRPVLEAMYCGVPIISTDVGIVDEALGKKQHEFIIGSRDNGNNDEIVRKKLKERIIYLYNNRNLFKELSDENLKSIQTFDGGKTIQAFDNFFEQFLDNKEVVS